MCMLLKCPVMMSTPKNPHVVLHGAVAFLLLPYVDHYLSGFNECVYSIARAAAARWLKQADQQLIEISAAGGSV